MRLMSNLQLLMTAVGTVLSFFVAIVVFFGNAPFDVLCLLACVAWILLLLGQWDVLSESDGDESNIEGE